MILNRRQFAGTLGLATLGMFARSAAARASVHSSAAAKIDLSFVNPELRPYARAYIENAEKDGSEPLTLQFIHKYQAEDAAQKIVFKKTPPVVKKWIPVPGGAPDVAAYLVNVKPGASRPGIIHTHGGGFVLGSAKEYVPMVQGWAAELDCFVATVEYRLAPQTRYAGSIEDNYSALRWVYRHARELGVDPARIAVAGESAGGGHAALLALTARDRGEVPVAFQALIYPMLDDRTGSSRQPPGNEGRIIWTPQDNRVGWEAFLGQEPGTPSVPAAAVPARRKDLAGLPPAFIGVGSIDLFCNEDMRYAERLAAAGIETELSVVPGAFHGFDLIAPRTELARGFVATKMRALRRAFGGDF
ncbi:MAG: alpha/beta hydrolase [Steroidobacteraceae bacterium]